MSGTKRWLLLLSLAAPLAVAATPAERRLLYVAVPGVRDYLEWGGAGVVVFDIDHGHSFVKRIAVDYRDAQDARWAKPENVKGVCASAKTGRLYVTTLTRLAAIDLKTDKLLWVKRLEGGCDRLSISPDGTLLYVPSLEGPHWNVVDANSGAVVSKLVTGSGAHNTLYSPDGARVYLAGLKSPVMSIADAKAHAVIKTAGPFGNVIRPFTLNHSETLLFVNVNGLLGFEMADLKTGQRHRVEVPGFAQGPVKRHGCPSHGVGLTPDEKELWIADSFNKRLHVFDATATPPRYLKSLEVSEEPGWVTFSIDGSYAYPSTGEVIDVKTKAVLAHLEAEGGAPVNSEKLVEIDFAGGAPVRVGDQFGIGRGR
jgi:DNA-binding beta-propeller fold protein YncE